MTDIVFSNDPGYYLSPFTLQLNFSSRVVGLQYTINGNPPAISKYIAYDTLNPPNPFIAVTQDGKGNVVYDGGFPKFYDTSLNSPKETDTTFSDLSPSFRYLFNSLRFIENKTKRAIGNNKVLLVGDSVSNYRVDVSGGNHFKNGFSRLAVIAGYDLTIKTRMDWGGQIDCDLAELEQYCCVIMMSSQSHQPATARYITDRAIEAFVDYRENGNGLMVITDHGPVLSSLAAAKAANYSAAFFGTANRIVTHFGAWFSGNYNRSPVPVGHIRSNYGDHPLYANLLDSENIFAGGSESRVFVEEFDPILPSQVPPIPINNGDTHIQIAALLDNGEVIITSAEYAVVSAKASFTNGSVIRDNGQVLDLGLDNRTTIDIVLDSPNMSVFVGATGIVTLNDQQIATVTYSTTQGTVMTWDDPSESTFLVNNGDRLSVNFASLNLRSTITLRRFQPPVSNQMNLATIGSLLRSYKPELTDIQRVQELIDEIAVRVPWRTFEHTQNMPNNLRELSRYFANNRDYINEPNVWWRMYASGGVFTSNDITELITDPDYWTLNPERGWHKDTYTYTAGSSVTREEQYSTIPADLVHRLREVSAVFTSYYNDLPRGLGRNVIYVQLDNGTELLLGTDDAWTSSDRGQNIYSDINHQGRGSSHAQPIDVVNERFTLTIPEGRYVTQVTFSSIGSSQVGVEYPFTKRGMKDFRFTFV